MSFQVVFRSHKAKNPDKPDFEMRCCLCNGLQMSSSLHLCGSTDLRPSFLFVKLHSTISMSCRMKHVSQSFTRLKQMYSSTWKKLSILLSYFIAYCDTFREPSSSQIFNKQMLKGYRNTQIFLWKMYHEGNVSLTGVISSYVEVTSG